MRRARLEALVASVPGGLDAPMGERGIRLSGANVSGLRLRGRGITIRLLVFDEATSALDAQTEQEVVEAIDLARGERTIIVIAHRLTTVRRCDSIIVLNNGRLVGQGGYDELLRDSEPSAGTARRGSRTFLLTNTRAAVVVVGDLGRSPRMQYHGGAGREWCGRRLCGYAGAPLPKFLADDPRVTARTCPGRASGGGRPVVHPVRWRRSSTGRG